MPTVTIGDDSFEAYVSVAEADSYIAGSITDAAVTWRAETDADDKARAVVEATRLLDRMTWLGTKTGGSDQTLAWPRANIDDVDDYVIPQKIADATCELAMMLLDGSTEMLSEPSTAPKTRRMKAGSVEIEYFRDANGRATRLPLTVHELVKDWLGGSTPSLAGAIATGVDGESAFSQTFGFSRGI